MIPTPSNDMPERYAEFFRRITENEIVPYQEEYGRDAFSPAILIVPTGLGKTDAALLPWLYAHSRPTAAAPTRLIFVLPRQNLTRQTAKIARTRVETAGLEIPVLELMAGSADNRETLRPDEPAIIVATQDLYFSRALNRGYARRPPRWPIDFALYNQDCLIVLDEIQLMDDALATSTQLAAFRELFKIYGTAPCLWMSATVNPDWLQTVDFRIQPRLIGITESDRRHPMVLARTQASKSVAKAPEPCDQPLGCADFALSVHEPGTRTLVIANTIARAREISAAIRAKVPEVVLLHSRFRPADRTTAAEKIATLPPEGQIVVSTQVLEAGVDISAKRLISDIAPWASLVQRFGRVNRYGEHAASKVWWVDAPTSRKQKDTAVPYSPTEIDRSRKRLLTISSASPASLAQIPEDGPAPYQHVLRRADLLDLFDTSADLSGNHIDVSRFIRASEDKDIYLAWRAWPGEAPPSVEFDDLHDDELCPVPVGEFRDFLGMHSAYTWNFATEEWDQVDRNKLYPGMIAITRCESGGYTSIDGWLPESKRRVEPIELAESASVDGDSSDNLSIRRDPQSLRAHTDRVVAELERLLGANLFDEEVIAALRVAAQKHDWGKVHSVFQQTMYGDGERTEVLAKSPRNGKHSRPHFRHELASALAMLQSGDTDLSAYLAAAHHGRVRLSIRSMPGETEQERRVARGVIDGDVLPACGVATGVLVPPVALSLEAMQFGATGGSWTERMLRVRDELGPFRLAYLEMMLRIADEAASAQPELEMATCN